MTRHYLLLVLAGMGINDALRDYTGDRFAIWSAIMLGFTIILLVSGWIDARKFANSATLLIEAEKDVDSLNSRLTKQLQVNITLSRAARYYLGTLRTVRDLLVMNRDDEAFKTLCDTLAEDTDTSIKRES